jgi:hypothetical protein
MDSNKHTAATPSTNSPLISRIRLRARRTGTREA